MALRQLPVNLFDATAAGATLARTLWPGTYTCSLPAVTNIQPAAANITSGGSVIGGAVFPGKGAAALLLDFAAVGAAGENLVVEVGKVMADGTLAEPLASVQLTSINSTIANVNPFTGAVTSGVTWRPMGQATVAATGQSGQVWEDLGGGDTDPSQVGVQVEEGTYYYVLVTSLGALTRVLCCVTPIGARPPMSNPAASSAVTVAQLPAALTSGGNLKAALVESNVGSVQAVAVTTDGAYGANDIVGGIVTVSSVNYASGRSVLLKSLQVNDKGNNSAALHVHLFRATPSGGTYTNNGNVTWGSGDSANRVGTISIATTDWVSDGSQCSVNLSGIDQLLDVAASSLFLLIIATGTPTYTNGDLTLKLGLEQR